MRWFLKDGSRDDLAYADAVLDSLVREREAVVPIIWGLEVANVIARSEATETRVSAFLDMLNDLKIVADLETYARSLTGILQLARQYKITAYDASYLELALRDGLLLATLDKDLRKAAKKAGAQVIM